MSFRRSALALVTAALAAGCGGKNGGTHEVSNPLQRRGRLEKTSHFTEAVGRNRIRVVAFDFGGVTLGQCATPEGDLISGSCVEYDFIRRGSNNHPRANYKLSETDIVDLNAGMFRQYSTRTDTKGDASLSVVVIPGKQETKISISHHVLIFEWRRYLLEDIPVLPSTQYFQTSAHVSAIEKGVGVRIVFSVSLRSTDAALAATFGFGSLATALARSEAEVEVGYELIGTTMDILPERATNITSVDGYMDAMTRFYDAVRRVSSAWECVDTKATRKVLPLPNLRSAKDESNSKIEVKPSSNCTTSSTSATSSPPSYTQAGQDAQTFQPGVLAYYVTGVRSETLDDAAGFSYGYQLGLQATSKGLKCQWATKQIQRLTGTPDRTKESIRAGLKQALADIRGGGGHCDDKSSAPGVDDINRAKAVLLPKPVAPDKATLSQQSGASAPKPPPAAPTTTTPAAPAQPKPQ